MLELGMDEGMELIHTALEAITEERLFQRWIYGAQNEMSFDDFKKEMYKQTAPSDNKTEDEILEEVRRIIDR